VRWISVNINFLLERDEDLKKCKKR
jgi:hypothetical protein